MQYDLALPLSIDCLDKRKALLGLDHADTLDSMNSLAVLYYKQGKYQEAEALYLECVQRQKTTLGLDHPLTTKTISNIKLLITEYRMRGNEEAVLETKTKRIFYIDNLL